MSKTDRNLFSRELPIDTRSKQIAIEHKFDIKSYDFPAQEEQLRKVGEI